MLLDGNVLETFRRHQDILQLVVHSPTLESNNTDLDSIVSEIWAKPPSVASCSLGHSLFKAFRTRDSANEELYARILDRLAESKWIQRSTSTHNDMSSLLQFHILVILLDALKCIQNGSLDSRESTKRILLCQIRDALPRVLFWISVNGHPVSRKGVEVIHRLAQLEQDAVLEALQGISDSLWTSVASRMDSCFDVIFRQSDSHPFLKYLRNSANRTDFVAQPGSVDRQFFRLLMFTLFELVFFEISQELSGDAALQTVFRGVRSRNDFIKPSI